MEQEQNESAEGSSDPIQTNKFFLQGCPFLGMRNDPNTSLSFPHKSNYCHRLESPVGIELAHQSGYCLPGNYASCYVYGQPEMISTPSEPAQQGVEPALPALSLASLNDSDLLEPRQNTLRQGLDSLKLRLLSLRLSLLLFKLRLRSSVPDSSRLKQNLSSKLPDMEPLMQGLLPLQQRWPELKQNLLSFDQQFASLRSKIPSSKISLPAGKLNAEFLKQRDLRLLALPLMLMLILLAAIIWWPPPGETAQDVVVMGASITNETADSAAEERGETASLAGPNRLQSESDAAVPAEPHASQVNPDDRNAHDQSAQIVAQKNISAVDEQELQAASPDSGDSLLSEDDGLEALAGPAASATLPQAAESETAVVDDAVTAEEQQTEPQTSAPQPVEEVAAETEEEDAVEAPVQESSGDPTTAAASPQAAASDALPAAAIASIGPDVNAQPFQEIYESPVPLYLYLAPGEDADVVARVSRKQPATILGRDSSGQWLLVRLTGGIEGWANTEESGADIVLSNLPVINAGVGDVSQAPASASLPVVSTAVVNIGALNLRSGPGTEYDSIGVVYNKQQVSLLQEPGGSSWVQVRLADGQLGWLNSNYLILSS